MSFVYFVCYVSSAAGATFDWPQILGPNRNGIYVGPEIVPSFPRSGPPQLWKRTVGAGFAGPTIVGNQLILFHRVNDKETVEAIDALSARCCGAATPAKNLNRRKDTSASHRLRSSTASE